MCTAKPMILADPYDFDEPCQEANWKGALPCSGTFRNWSMLTVNSFAVMCPYVYISWTTMGIILLWWITASHRTKIWCLERVDCSTCEGSVTSLCFFYNCLCLLSKSCWTLREPCSGQVHLFDAWNSLVDLLLVVLELGLGKTQWRPSWSFAKIAFMGSREILHASWSSALILALVALHL